MENLALFRNLIISGLAGVNEKRLAVSNKTWASSGRYLVDHISAQNEITFRVNDSNALIHSLAFDSAKFATAAFETAIAIRGTDGLPKSLGWCAVKAYYGAFFSVQALLRMFGHTATFLARGQIQAIHDFASVTAAPNHGSVQSGLYVGCYDQSTGLMRIRPGKHSHKDTWAEFGRMLGSLSSNVLGLTAISAQKNALAGEIEDLRKLLNDNDRLSKCNWLCDIRNSINYELSHHVWFPYGPVAITMDEVSRIVAQWNTSEGVVAMGGHARDESVGFFVLCTKIMNLCYRLSSLVAEMGRDDTGSCHQRTRRFLKHIAAA